MRRNEKWKKISEEERRKLAEEESYNGWKKRESILKRKESVIKKTLNGIGVMKWQYENINEMNNQYLKKMILNELFQPEAVVISHQLRKFMKANLLWSRLSYLIF